MDAGQAFAHNPHPTHFSTSTLAYIPSGIVIASLGQAFLQLPQPTHCRVATFAYFLIYTFLTFFFLSFCISFFGKDAFYKYSIMKNAFFLCDFVTLSRGANFTRSIFFYRTKKIRTPKSSDLFYYLFLFMYIHCFLSVLYKHNS